MEHWIQFPVTWLMWSCGAGFAARRIKLLEEQERSAEKGEHRSAAGEEQVCWAETAGESPSLLVNE